MKKKLFLALLTTLLLLLAASTALAADYSDYTCTSCGNPCDGWYPLSHNSLNYHVPACYSCGIALLDKKEHCTPEDGTATCKLAPRCSVCSLPMSLEYEPDPDAHSMVESWSFTNETQHFRVCQNGCGKTEYADHTGGTATCTQLAVCDVCNSGYGALSDTNHGEFSDWEPYTATQHYRYCIECRENYDYADHTGGTATCTQLAECEVCHKLYGDLSDANHGAFTEWTPIGDTQHYRHCMDCGNNAEYADHTGGTATCTERAVCDVCHTEYGEFSDTNHGEFCDWMSVNNTQHLRYCTSCAMNEEYADHTGGTATCMEYAVCEVCHGQYGELSDANHGEFTDWMHYDDTQHYRSCIDCRENREYADHTGGTATCASGPICEVCGVEYGEPLSTHNGPFGEWEKISVGQHGRMCETCRGYEREDHTGGTATCAAYPVCDVCHEEYGSRASTHTGNLSYESFSMHHHYTTCDVCNQTFALPHTGGTATCESGPICELCKTAYGESLGGHDWGEWASNGDGTHTRVCLRDAAHTETADCSGGTATCVAPAVCEVCGEAYGEADPDAHDYVLTESTPGTCIDPGLDVYTCQNEGCPDPVLEETTEAFGQHLYNHWSILGSGVHHTDCALCGGNTDVACTLWGMMNGETLLTVCPVCGDFGETPFGVLIAREDKAVPIGTLLVRGMENPFDGTLYGVTVAGVYGGEVVNIHGMVTITLPVACEGFTVVRVEIVEDKEVRTEIPFTLEDGQLTFTTDAAGLFLLVPAE